MKTKTKSIIILLGLIIGLMAVPIARADIHQLINAGIDYLEANQDASTGLWGTDKETPFRDAAVVVDVLAKLDIDYVVDPTKISSGFQAIDSLSTPSTDYLARKIMAEAAVNQGVVDPYLIDKLVGIQNDDGGWGYQKFYGSNMLETALAIQALVAASYVDATPSVVYAPASTFLISNQHSTDYGWGFAPGGASKVLFTAHVVIALSALQDYNVAYNFSTPIANAFSYFQSMQDVVDGGFASDVSSNAYETGLAIVAMIAHDPVAPEIQKARGYLKDSKLANGSWNNDAYSTAMAIYGLYCIIPYLYDYLPGDANMGNGGWSPPPAVSPADQTYLVNYFRGITPGCLLTGFYAPADVNGDCAVLAGDVTRYVAYFKGTATISYCPDYPPAWPTTSDLPASAPSGWPNCDARFIKKPTYIEQPTNQLDNTGD